MTCLISYIIFHMVFDIISKKQVSMNRKHHNHTLQTNTWYHVEERQNTNRNKTSGTLPKPPQWEGGGLNAFYWYQILVLDYVVVKAQQLFGSHGKMKCFRYRYPDSCLSEKSINSTMQHLQNIISFNFLYLQK